MLTSAYYNEAGHANIEIDDGAENNFVNLLPYLFSKLATCVEMEHSELLLTVCSKSKAPSSYQQCTSKCSPFDRLTVFVIQICAHIRLLTKKQCCLSLRD